jgi:ceramide kinase
MNSALLIILGRRMSLDIGQVVRWKSSPTAEVLPTVRYAASFAGYHLPLRDGTNYFI